MRLADLKPSITELTPEAALSLIEQVQASRLVSKTRPKKVSKKPSGKIHGLMSKEGRIYTSWCKKERDCNAKEPRMSEQVEEWTCKACKKAYLKSNTVQEGEAWE